MRADADMTRITKDTIDIKRVTDGTHSWEYSVGADARLVLVFLIEAAGKVSVTPSVHLTGRRAEATVVGIVTGRSTADIEIVTLQHHAAPETTSNLLVKEVLSGSGKSAYRGSIAVDKAAQKTDAYQRNENLLLGSAARATSSPALEILANDVRCTHGATVATIDADQLWYLTSRGIDGDTARAMIASGFLMSALDPVTDPKMRGVVERELIKGE